MGADDTGWDWAPTLEQAGPVMTPEELRRHRLRVVAGLVAFGKENATANRRVNARLRIRARCRAYFASLLDQHRQTGAILTVDPLPVTRRQ